jgi:hypothetical protein
MKHMHQQSSWSSSKYHEPVIDPTFTDQARQANADDATLLAALMATGFSREEATRLSDLHTHLYENIEIRQLLSSDHRLQFARWLFEQGEMHENGDSEPG